MTDFQLTTPVAFLIFNRPDTTARVFEAIRQAKPPKLLVVADGPRPDKADDIEKCKKSRAIIDGVDWDCEVLTNYSGVNLGCKKRVSSGLDWVFEIVEEAIILEDDCLPHPTFFRYCEELLKYYRSDTRIMHINGTNHGLTDENCQDSYRFSKLANIWGWAAWRRSWQYYDVKMSVWSELMNQDRLLKDLFKSKQELKTRKKNWDLVYYNKIDTWDYQWLLACICQGGLTIMPRENLIANIGFGVEATRTKDETNKFANLPIYPIEFPLIHPKSMLRDIYSDHLIFRHIYKKNLRKNILQKLKNVLKSYVYNKR